MAAAEEPAANAANEGADDGTARGDNSDDEAREKAMEERSEAMESEGLDADHKSLLARVERRAELKAVFSEDKQLDESLTGKEMC